MQKSRPILPIIAATVAVVLIVGWRYYEARFLSAEPARANDPFVLAGGPAKDGIPPIDNPKFEKAADADQYLKDTGEGIDVAVNGAHRFYPFQILVWHEVVNDTFGSVPLVITYDPLTGTAAAYKRNVNNSTATFTTSGKLWNDNTLLEDRASSTLWAEGTGEALSGPLTGTRLDPYPTTVMAWKDWKVAYPSGDVLTRDTGATRDYTRDPYADYYATSAVWYPVSRVDPRLSAKTPVFGLLVNGIAKAYPVATLQVVRSLDETFGTTTVHIAFDEKLNAITASSAGKPIPFEPAYWFFWAAAYPDTQLYEAP